MIRPIASIGVIAVTAAVAAYLRSPSRSIGASSSRRQSLIEYLRDHLGGSDVAIRVVHHLVATHDRSEDAMLFRRLSSEFEEDQIVVRSLLTRLGGSARSLKRAAGYASGSLLSVTAGGGPGDLSLFRTLEALAIGVQGKRCMWRALQDVYPLPSSNGGVNFTELEAKAVRQWEAIEQRRRALVTTTFSAVESEVSIG